MPNLSEGADPDALAALEAAFATGAQVLDQHADVVHGRSVFTLAAAPARLGQALLSGAAEALGLIDLRRHAGVHPHVGALDVCPIVYPDPLLREPAVALANDVAEGLAALGLPVFLYGELAVSAERRERHFFRHGGIEALGERMSGGELTPDLGPRVPHPSAGAVLVTARPPLAAFNVELEGVGLEAGREIAAELRESGGGMSGVRALAIDLGAGTTQISTNVHDPVAVGLGSVVAEVERLAAPRGGRAVAAELIGLVPEAALNGYPERVPIRDFDLASRTIEARLAGP